eukprot:scaffold6834_cov44-Cyclotella_meneghiniana.AAC.3
MRRFNELSDPFSQFNNKVMNLLPSRVESPDARFHGLVWVSQKVLSRLFLCIIEALEGVIR